MYLEIVSPESIIFNANVDSVTVPGVNGEFQMLENHAAVVSLLKQGDIKIHLHNQEPIDLEELSSALAPQSDDDKILIYPINSGTLEMNDNKVIILAE